MKCTPTLRSTPLLSLLFHLSLRQGQLPALLWRTVFVPSFHCRKPVFQPSLSSRFRNRLARQPLRSSLRSSLLSNLSPANRSWQSRQYSPPIFSHTRSMWQAVVGARFLHEFDHAPRLLQGLPHQCQRFHLELELGKPC